MRAGGEQKEFARFSCFMFSSIENTFLLRINTILSIKMKIDFILLFSPLFCKLSLQQKEHNGSPLKVEEIRMVKIGQIGGFDHPLLVGMDNCVAKRNKHTKTSTYFIKKRLTDRSKNPSLPKYQFVAALDDLFKPTNVPNEVYTEWGTIFCEESVLNGVTRRR